MPIIDNVDYNDHHHHHDIFPKTIIFQLYNNKASVANDATKDKRRRFAGFWRFLSKFKIMPTEENIVRPRKTMHHNWERNELNGRSVFRIGEFQQNNNEMAITLPAITSTSHTESEIKYKPKSVTHKVRKAAKTCLRQLENYFENSTLHGLKYIGSTSLSLGERLFWAIAFLSALSFAAYYITNIFDKWNTNPVLIAFSPFDADLNEIPFPAITICNMNQAKKDEAEKILKEGNEVEKKLLNEYCDGKSNYTNLEDDAPDWEIVQNFLIRVGQSCSDTIKTCMWGNTPIDCNFYFNNDLTDEGLCCSFNRLPPNIVYRNANDLPVLNQSYPNVTYDWTPEHGFPDKNSGNISVIPIRPSGAGTHLGLTLVIDADVDNYYCSSTSSVGFKIMFSNPMESPKIADFGYLVSPGNEVRYAFQPDIREATKSLGSVPISKRQCYFESERKLLYYRTYSSRNCRLECQSKYTFDMCSCIPYYLPRTKNIRVCGKFKEECVKKAKDDMELVYGNASSCNCLPGCFEMIFDKSDTQSTLWKMTTNYNMDRGYTEEEFRKNLALVHFYFKESRFRKQIKSEIYGFTEALSNIGGLLGLCLGFSFLSVVEIFYFVTLRIFCRFIKTRKTEQQRQQAFHHLPALFERQPNSRNIPFMK